MTHTPNLLELKDDDHVVITVARGLVSSHALAKVKDAFGGVGARVTFIPVVREHPILQVFLVLRAVSG